MALSAMLLMLVAGLSAMLLVVVAGVIGRLFNTVAVTQKEENWKEGEC